jgi:glycosyltransferase involved in cell wall biosynthesis
VARLLFVTGTPANVRGGSGTFVGISVLRRAVEALGHSVDLLAPPKGSPDSFAWRLLFNLRARRVARNFRPDVLVGFDLDGLWVDPGSARRVAAIKGVRSEEARFEGGLARAKLAIESFFEGIHVRHSWRILAPSRHSASQIVRDYRVAADRVHVVPEPIELARWREAMARAEALPHGPPSILCVAHLYPRKDVATLLAAMKKLPAETVLRVAGDGPELPSLRALSKRLALEGRVEFLGHVPFTRLAGEYRRADVFCLPSRQEGFGIVFLEAMAASLPIVAARAAAVPEVVGNEDAGLLVPPSDSGSLARALGLLVADPERRRRLGEAGRRRVERFDAPRVAEEFLQAVGLSDGISSAPR